MSNFIKTTFEGDKTAKVIELKEESLTKVCFGKILEYMAYHFNNPAKEIDQPLKNKNMKENVSEWDADFIDIPISNKDLLFALTNSANYLDVKPLLELCCAKIASELEGRTTEEMRKILNVVNDFTPEEEQELIERDKWLDECDK
jgi:S-phase kinase-associated protein 1